MPGLDNPAPEIVSVGGLGFIDGHRFVRAEHLELFKADPVRYPPQFAGFCAVALARGEIDEGNPEYWLLSEGKLYLFGKPIGPALFQQDLAGNLVKAEQSRPLIVNR